AATADVGMGTCPAALHDDDGFDFELGALGQGGYTDGGARGVRLRNDVGHDGVGAAELAQVGQEQRELHDVVECAAGGFDHGLHVGKGLAHLPFEVFGHQFTSARFEADLARQIDSATTADGGRLGIRAHRCRSVVGMYDFLGHERYP